MRNPFNIDSTGYDIRGDQNRDPACIESSQAALASVLTFVRVDRVGGNPVAREMPHHAVRTMFGSSKHQRSPNLVALQDINQQ